MHLTNKRRVYANQYKVKTYVSEGMMNKKISRLMIVIITAFFAGALVFIVTFSVIKKPLSQAASIKKLATDATKPSASNYKTMGMCGGLLRIAEESITGGCIDEKKFYFTCLVYLDVAGELIQKEKQQGSSENDTIYSKLDEKRFKKLFLWGEDFYKHKEKLNDKALP